MDLDELYIKYDELIEAGQINPNQYTVEDFVADYYSASIVMSMIQLDDC